MTYVGVDSQNGEMEKETLKKLFGKLNIPLLDLPKGLHLEYRDGFGIAVNYSDQTLSLPISDAQYIIGGQNLKTADVAVWKEK